MAVSGVNNTATQTQSQTSTTALNQDFDQFLRLLTTQLQNQDPLSPMDSSEFTNQLVQFSNVEQSIRTNSFLEKLLTMQTLNLTALGVSFIGKDVEVAGKFFQADGVKPVSMSYDMPVGADEGTLSIIDKDGNVVFTQNADITAGRHNFTWDGKDSSGNLVPAGKYEIRVGAQTSTDAALNVTTFVPGHVNGLESAEDGSLMLNVDGNLVNMTDVRKISEPTT
ncbi:MAG: flagellar hook assembly protein FlgD [Alphaproteobacteria bacterium]